VVIKQAERDFLQNLVKGKIDTYLYRDPNIKRLVELKPIYKPVDHKLNEIMEQIEKLIVIPMTNLDDIFTILTNKEKLDTVLQIGLDKKYLQYKHKLVEFFISIKSNATEQDLVVRSLSVHNIEKINVLYVMCLPISSALTALVRIFGYV